MFVSKGMGIAIILTRIIAMIVGLLFGICLLRQDSQNQNHAEEAEGKLLNIILILVSVKFHTASFTLSASLILLLTSDVCETLPPPPLGNINIKRT